MVKKHYSKGISIFMLAIVYAVATVIVWGFGIVFENVSVYDPYWSVAPPA